jgi:glycosyltransferase involved in cell wall biosynthesis
MNAPLLTVITPVYNGERFIEGCLRSVISQNCPEVEHLIIDGGSTDRTLQIVKRYAQWNPHLRWVSKKDRGQSSAMNKGIVLARGKVVGFLNYDDYYQPGVLNRVLEIFETLPSPSFLAGNCNVLNDDERIVYLNKPSRLSLTNVLIGGEKNQFPFNPSAYFYHKSLHVKVGLFDESNHYTMDLDFILRALKAAHVKYMDETWGNFRYIRGTKTFQTKEDNLLDEYKMHIMNVHLEKLPGIQRAWIKMVRFLFIQRKLHYYAGRVMDCLKDPKEIHFILEKKLGHHPQFNGRKHSIKPVMHSHI